MCGIVGVFDGRNRPDISSVIEMNRSISHRGPDDEGIVCFQSSARGIEGHLEFGGPDTPEGLQLPEATHESVAGHNLALGHRRLSILDLRPDGHCPMNWDKKFWITFNGEIYNFKEIRAQLSSLGYSFRSQTDTEVLLTSYIEWGESCVSKFNGMFAFAIVDIPKNQIFLARDRFGIKPLYYYWDGDLFCFSSEIKGILSHKSVSARPNDHIVYDYLVTGSIDHTEETFFEKIHRFPARHFGVFDLSSKAFRKIQYWDLALPTIVNPTIDVEEIVSTFREKFLRSIELRMRSDVPVGSTLSGGLDSSSIACAMSKYSKGHNVFSVFFDEKNIDERPYIDAVCDQLGLTSHKITASTSQGIWSDIDSFQRLHDEPVSSTSMYAQWLVMKLVKDNGIKVILDGQGADEILGGYVYYLGPFLANLLRTGRYLQFFGMLGKFSENSRSSRLLLGALATYHAIPKGVAMMGMNVGNKYFRRNSTFPTSHIHKQFSQGFRGRKGVSKNAPSRNSENQLRESLLGHSVPALLRYEDRNSMAHSIEARVPFLDHELVEYMFTVPSNVKLKDGWTKWPLRRALESELPKEVAWRRGKLGFETPEKNWIHEGRHWLKNYTQGRELLSNRYIKKDALLSYVAGQNIPGIWRAMNLEVWLRNCVDAH